MRLEIEYIEDGERRIRLLSERERFRVDENARALDKRIGDCDKEELWEQKIEYQAQKRALEDELATDDALRADPSVRVLAVTLADPTMEMLAELKRTASDPAAAAARAVEILKPSAEEGAIPYEFLPFVTDVCLQAFYPNPSEDRRFFLRRRLLGHRG